MRYLTFAVVLVLSSCVTFGVKEEGNGRMVDETYNVSDFNSISIGGAYSVLLVPSSNEKVEVEIDENLLEYLVVEVSGSTLNIYNSERIFSDDGISITIFYREIEEILVSGACELKNEDTLEGERFSVNMSGAGAIELDLDVEDLILEISGAGAVKLKGKAESQRIRMSGAGGYSGFDLASTTAKIDISGVGSADITVYEELDASISGLGGIKYKGDPDFVNSDVGGLGTISRAD